MNNQPDHSRIGLEIRLRQIPAAASLDDAAFASLHRTIDTALKQRTATGGNIENLTQDLLAETANIITELDTATDPRTQGLKLALHVSEHFNNLKEQAWVHNRFGALRHGAGLWDQAHDEFTQALDLYTQLGLVERQAWVHNNLGAYYRYTGRWDQALDSYARALQLLTQLGLTKDQARVRTNLAGLHRDTGRWDQAHNEFTQALQLYTDLELTQDQAHVHTNLGDLHRGAGRWNQAQYEFAQALQLYTQLGLTQDQASAHNNLGIFYQEVGRWDQAHEDFTQALQLYSELNLSEGQARTHGLLSSLAVAQSQPDAALNHFNTAVTIYRAQNLHQDAAWAAVTRARELRASNTATPAEAISLALPAALFLDEVRFHFRTAPERLAWAATTAKATSLVMELAAESNNPQLVTDLAETTINNTTHTTQAGTRDTSGDRVVPARALGIETTETATSKTPEPLINNKPTGGDEAAYTAAGATTLLSTAALPGYPSPPLLTPTDRAPHVALEHWNTKDYPPLPRPVTPVRTW